METICIKVEENLLKEIDGSLAKHRYSTRTEFIRDAIRSKLTALQREEAMLSVDRLLGSQKLGKTDKDLHRIRAEIAKDWEMKK